jgi:CRP-like cAMP-binding protein
LKQFQRLVHELQVVDPADLSIQSWIPHMKLRRMKAGETLIRQGDRVDSIYSIYYLLDGQPQIPELGKTLDPGAVVGEIGVFAQMRSAPRPWCAAPTAASTSSAKIRPSNCSCRIANSDW